MTVRLVTALHKDHSSHPRADGEPRPLLPVVSDRPAQRWSPAPVCGAEWDDRQMAATHEQVALVTGSSRGLGAVIARRLAHDGVAVAVNGRPGDEQVAAVSR